MNGDINKAIEQIADSLGVTVDKLYPILHKQAMLDVVFNSLWILFFIAGMFVFLKLIKYAKKKQQEETYHNDWDWDEPNGMMLLFLGGLFSFVGVIVIIVCSTSIVTALFNTEYYMIKDILNQIGGD